MKQTIRTKTIGLNNKTPYPLGDVVQGNDVVLNLKFIDNNKEVDLTNQTVRVGGGKSDGGLVEQSSNIIINKDTLTIELIKGFTEVVGKVYIELTLKDTRGLMTTAKFFINVTENILNDESVSKTDIFDSVDKVIIGLNTDYDSLKKVIIDDNASADLQEQIKKTNTSISNIDYSIKKEIEVINSVVDKNKNFTNKFLANYNGLCVRSWNTGDFYNDRFRIDLINNVKKTNANAIALTINLYQDKYNSSNPVKREPISVQELSDYIKFLKNSNLRVLFKPHVELDAEGSESWRAMIDPTNHKEWFSKYTEKMIEYAKICEELGVECFSVGSEYRKLTEKYPNEWIKLIKTLRNHYTGIMTYAGNLNNDISDEYNTITFWGELDLIGIDFYVYPFENGSFDKQKSGFCSTKNGRNVVSLVEGVASQYKKPFFLAEYGKYGNTEDKRNILKATTETFFNNSGCLGGFLWVHDPQITDWFETDSVTCDNSKFNNVEKIQSNFGNYFRSSENGGWQKFLTYTMQENYSDLNISFDFIATKETYAISTRRSTVDIKVIIQDGKPRTFMGVDGNIDNTNFTFVVEGNIINFFVKCENKVMLYKPIVCFDINMVEIFQYQATNPKDLDVKSFQNKGIVYQCDEYLIFAVGNGYYEIKGRKNFIMSGGKFEINIPLNLSTITKNYSNICSCSVLNGGESFEVLTSCMLIDKTLNIKGKHATIEGNYSGTVDFSSLVKVI